MKHVDLIRIQTRSENYEFFRKMVHPKIAIVNETEASISVIVPRGIFRKVLQEVQKQNINPYTVMEWLSIKATGKL